MPEGDTLHRTAATLRRALAGQSLTAFESPLPALSPHAVSLAGRTVADVTAHGKNLRIVFDDGRVLYSHMKMTGSWHLYRPEVLFLCGLDPFAPVSAVSDDDLDRLLATARGLMVRNLHGGPRRTRFSLDPGRGWVYRRSGRPCRRCGTRITMRRQGASSRSTYFCPACQTPAQPTR